MVIMLKRKMLRDIRKNLSQFITIFLMVMIGIMAYSGIKSYMDGMSRTADKFYSENNLFDLNVVGNLNHDDLKNIKSIDNVKDAELKLSVTAITDNDKTLLLNFIESNNISKFFVFEGEKFNAKKSGIWLDRFYAQKNNIKVGDTILVKYDGMILHEKVLGIINVPDHLYDRKDESEIYPDKTKFGFAYMSTNEISEDYVKKLVMKKLNVSDENILNKVIPNFNYKEYIPFSSIMVSLKDKNKKDFVGSTISYKIENAKVVVDVKNTLSYGTYQGEIDEGKTYVGVFSGIFIFIAILSVITTMTRVINKQRIQIGTLKALGFSNRKILFHYISYGFWISLIASILGLILGYYVIGNMFINFEMSFFEIPSGAPYMDITNYYVAALIVLVVSFIVYMTGRSILKENPAETLRNKIPSVKGKILSITKNRFFKKLNFAIKWNIRDILRNKARTFMGFVGVVGCSMLIVCALGMLDTVNNFIKLQFEDLYNFKYKLIIKEDIKANELQSLYDKYGNNTSKTILIETKEKNGTRKINNIFITDANDYVRFIDNKDKFKDKPKDDGVYVTYKLATSKGYKLGDEITWHIYGESKYYKSKIIGFNKDPQNQNISMSRKYLESLNIKYKPDTIYTNIDLSKVSEIKNIKSIQNVKSLKEDMNGMLSMIKKMLVLIVSVAVLLGVIIIYNLGIISYTEKEYQFATLKVLGFKDKQIKNIFIKQNNLIAIISILFGLPLGFCLTDYLFQNAMRENYDIGTFITNRTYIIAAIGTFLVSYIVSKFLAIRIKKIDMVKSLKCNE